jgi:glutamine synthetase
MNDICSDDHLVQLDSLPDDIDTVILAGTDTHGIMRGKRVPRHQLQRLLANGMPMCDVFWVMHIDESDLVARPANHAGYFPTEKNGYPDILARPDAIGRRVPWHPNTVLALVDFFGHDNKQLPIDPRGVLKRVVERTRGLGYEPYLALELEFYVLRETSTSLLTRLPSELHPLSGRPSTYGIVKAAELEPMAGLIRRQALEFGLPIEACNPETGPGQFEITLQYRPALQATDDAALFKTAVKELAAQQGLIATFMAKPRSDWAGNSCHIHLSLRDSAGNPAFFDDTHDHGFSKDMLHFIGGSLSTMAEMSALFGPTINSYHRYTPYSWAATSPTWGIDNRSVGIRAIEESAEGTRIEHRRGGGDANPYLAAAAVLSGGMHGIAKQVDAPLMFIGDVYASQDRVEQLPSSLAEALQLLSRGAVVRDWLGDDFVDHFVAMKHDECRAHAQAVTDWEIRRYLEAL